MPNLPGETPAGPFRRPVGTFAPMHTITVVGAGTMGNGIAHVFAQHGRAVRLLDLDGEALDRARRTIERNLDRQVAKERLTSADAAATLERIALHTDLREAAAGTDLVVEVATENEAVKRRLFGELDEAAPPAALLATNTSSISITRLAAATRRPGQVIGMHFMNPVPIMRLVEVIRGYATDDDTAAAVVALARDIGKIPVEVNDYPGFVSNRILMPMINEAISTLWQGVAGVEEIDTVMMLGMAHPMGPLHLADFIGLDVCLSILRVLQEGFGEAKYAPCPLLVNMVAAGRLGVKSGEGFYVHEGKERRVSPRF